MQQQRESKVEESGSHYVRCPKCQRVSVPLRPHTRKMGHQIRTCPAGHWFVEFEGERLGTRRLVVVTATEAHAILRMYRESGSQRIRIGTVVRCVRCQREMGAGRLVQHYLANGCGGGGGGAGVIPLELHDSTTLLMAVPPPVPSPVPPIEVVSQPRSVGDVVLELGVVLEAMEARLQRIEGVVLGRQIEGVVLGGVSNAKG